jgi:hypothetical protein
LTDFLFSQQISLGRESLFGTSEKISTGLYFFSLRRKSIWGIKRNLSASRQISLDFSFKNVKLKKIFFPDL